MEIGTSAHATTVPERYGLRSLPYGPLGYAFHKCAEAQDTIPPITSREGIAQRKTNQMKHLQDDSSSPNQNATLEVTAKSNLTLEANSAQVV